MEIKYFIFRWHPNVGLVALRLHLHMHTDAHLITSERLSNERNWSYNYHIVVTKAEKIVVNLSVDRRLQKSYQEVFNPQFHRQKKICVSMFKQQSLEIITIITFLIDCCNKLN